MSIRLHSIESTRIASPVVDSLCRKSICEILRNIAFRFYTGWVENVFDSIESTRIVSPDFFYYGRSRLAREFDNIALWLSPPQRFKHSLYQSAVRSVPQAQSRMGSIRRRTSARCMSISRTSLSFSRTSMDFSALAKFDSLKLTETHC